MEAIRVLWEETPMSASQIAVHFGVSKNSIVGLARRRGWKSFNPAAWRNPPKVEDGDSWAESNLSSRLLVLHRQMDEIIGLDDSGSWGPNGRWIPGKRKELPL